MYLIILFEFNKKDLTNYQKVYFLVRVKTSFRDFNLKSW